MGLQPLPRLCPREAFHLLQREGLVRIDAHRGATVVVPTAADLREYYEIRTPLEALAVAKAAERFRDEDAANLEATAAS